MSEIDNYRRKEPHDDQYCLEIFHRAILQRDDDAWSLLMDRFRGMVMAWVHAHPRSDVACRYDKEENYVALAFERFWQATTRNEGVRFTSLEAALSYLKTSLNSTILDTLRAHARPEVPLPEPGQYFPEELSVEDEDTDSDLWEIIRKLLPAEREQRLAFLLFHSGLKPREVVQFLPQEFNDVQEVYRLRRNIIERLLRNADSIRWRLRDE